MKRYLKMQQTYKIKIQGQVQGVGFRPFVYRLAKQLDVQGEVLNDESGVNIVLTTTDERLQQFIQQLTAQLPKPAIIQSHSLARIASKEFKDFQIIPSEKNNRISIPITPDFAVCAECKLDVLAPENRRYQYAFTSCVRCGPRYAITKDYPFEREHTSLKSFPMCANCQKEYTNANDRRFHAQTLSCPQCGVSLILKDAAGNTVESASEKIISETAKLLLNGLIVAIKSTSGYLLCCDASNTNTITRLRNRKHRPEKPFALLYPSIQHIEEQFQLTQEERDALLSPEAPIVVLQSKKQLKTSAHQAIAPGLNSIGIMLPASTLLYLLMSEVQRPIVATSGNIHGSPIISEEKIAATELAAVADYFVHHNLNIKFPQDDSVVTFAKEQRIILRRSRGMAPNFFNTITSAETAVLAMGAHLKATFAFMPTNRVYVSQYFGNLDNYDVLERYKNTIQQYVDVFETRPITILIDAHPNYGSSILGSELADDWNASVVEIQHHKAHFASVLAEHELFSSEEKILGVIWDGTGFGDDRAIWGGEFFTYQNNKIERISHLDYFDWIASDKMAKEPRIALLSLLSERKRETIRYKFSKTEWSVYAKLLKGNTLKTSSMGRLFDAVSSLLRLTDQNTYEGEAAMLLEACAGRYNNNVYINFLEDPDYTNFPTRELLHEIVKVYEQGIPIEQIAASFIYTLAVAILRVAKNHAITLIACSGGVFQNKILVRFLLELTENTNTHLKINCNLSSNDENIALGQLAYFEHIKT